MLTKVTSPLHQLVSSILLATAAVSCAQQPTVQPTTLAPGLSRISGIEDSSKIEYVRLFLEGAIVPPPGAVPSTSAPLVPVLTAQCTLPPSGKQAFELFANFGGIDDLAYYPPWKPTGSGDLFPPRLQKFKLTMEFLGYTHVKPVKREWEAVLQPPGQYRYNPPSSTSSNLEDSPYYLRFLLALPTLRLTLADKSAEFRTTPLLDQIRKEPLCKAAGL